MLARTAVLFVALGLVLPVQAQQTAGPQIPATSAGGNVSVLYGYTPEQLRELIANADHAKQELDDLQHRLGLTEGAGMAVLHAVGQEDVPPEQLARKLIEAADQYHAAVAQVAALKPDDPVTQALVDRAQAAITAGRFSEAHQLLREARAANIAAAHAARDIQEKAGQAADARLLQAAQSSAAEGNIAMTELHYLDAAQHFQDAADLVPPGHPDDKGGFLLAQAGALQQQGDEGGDNAALTKAISVYRFALQEWTRDRVPLQWGGTQINLGNALQKLGERENGTARLEEGVDAYRLACTNTPASAFRSTGP